MQHFENLPTITYTPSNVDSTASMKNIFNTLEFTINNNNFVELYVIEGIKRLDSISFELYDTTEYWWILAKLNSINNIIYDLPIDEGVLRNVATDRTLDADQGGFSSLDDTGAMEYYIGQFEKLVEENDSKRQINVIKPIYMGDVITEIIKSL